MDGYGEATSSDERAQENIAQLTGATAGRLHGCGLGAAPVETAARRRRFCFLLKPWWRPR